MALATFELALNLLDRIPRVYKGDEAKLLIAQFTFNARENAIKAALQAYDKVACTDCKEKAFLFTEKNKTVILSHLLRESWARQFAGVPSELLEKEKEIRMELANSERERERERESADSSRVFEAENRFFSLQLEYENLIKKMEKLYPKYYDLKYQTQTATVSDVQKSLDDNTALLEYFLGDSAIFAFAITKHDFEVVEIKKAPSFNSQVTDLATSFKNITSRAAYLKNAAGIYNILIKPLESKIASKHKWIIIPDGEIYQVPFEALLYENVSLNRNVDYRNLPYLLKQHEISYHYAATLFLKNQQDQSMKSYAKDFVAFAPVFSRSQLNGFLPVLDTYDLIAFTAAAQDKTSYLITRDGQSLDELLFSEHESQAYSKCSKKIAKQEVSMFTTTPPRRTLNNKSVVLNIFMLPPMASLIMSSPSYLIWLSRSPKTKPPPKMAYSTPPKPTTLISTPTCWC